MTTAAIKKQLHEFIDTAQASKLRDLYKYVENSNDTKYTCSAEELQILHERAEKYMRGEGTTYTIEEAHNYIRNSWVNQFAR